MTGNSGPWLPNHIISTAGTTRAARSTFVMNMMERRLQRSRNTPTYGPIREYGSSSTAKPVAMASGPACFSGLNSTLPASPDWNHPSPTWLTNRTASRRRNPRSTTTARRLCAWVGWARVGAATL